MHLVVHIYIFRFVSNLTKTIVTVTSHYNVSVVNVTTLMCQNILFIESYYKCTNLQKQLSQQV